MLWSEVLNHPLSQRPIHWHQYFSLQEPVISSDRQEALKLLLS